LTTQRAGSSRRDLLTPTFVRIMAVNFGYFLSIGVINPILPRFINGPLHQSDVGVGIGLAAFTVTALLLRQYSGRLGDRRGRHFGIRVGCVANAIAMFGLLGAHSLAHVVALRLIGGIAEAFIFVGVATAVQDISPDDRRGEAASLFSLSLFVALAIGPVLGELVLDHFGYAGVWIFAGASGVFGLIVSLTIPDTRTHHDLGAATPPLVHRAAVRPGAILGCAIWGLAAFNGYVPLYALKLGMSGAGSVFLVNAVVIMVFRSVGARIPDRIGPLRAASAAMICAPAGLVVMGLWRTVAGLFAGAVILGCGQALAFPALMTIAVNNAPGSERGAVMGTFTAFFDISFGGGVLMLGIVAGALGYNGAFLIAAAVAALGLVTLAVAPPPARAAAPAAVFEIEPPGE
jgi:MFS family permease